MAVDRRVPVVAAEERGGQLARRLHVLVAAQDVRDLAGVFLVNAVEGEAGETLGRLGVDRPAPSATVSVRAAAASKGSMRNPSLHSS